MLPQPFNNPSTYPNHSGVDYGQPMDKTIKASGKGTVHFVGWLNDRAGWSTVIDYGACGVLYAHQPVSPGIKPGASVSEGSQIGRVGTSGNSTGPHVHMEIMWGEGAHTYDGVWKHFSKTAVIGDGSASGGESTTNESEDDMGPHIAVLGDAKTGKWYLIQNVKGQPTGHLLGAASGASTSGLPIIFYVDKWAQDQVKKTTVFKS